MNIVIIGIGNIGYELVKILVPNNKIVLIARNMPEHAKAFIDKNANVVFEQGDATSEADMAGVRDRVSVKYFNNIIDLLILSPGVNSTSTPMKDFDSFSDCFNTNYYANIIPLKIFLKNMLQNNNGKVIVLSATSGHHADKRLSGYPASKWALENSYSSLREEVRAKNISVDVIAVRTIKNKYSKVWVQNNGEDPAYIAKYISRLVVKPRNHRHFIPKHYFMVRFVERMFPSILNRLHGLKNRRARATKFRNLSSTNVLVTGAASGLGKALAFTYAESAKVLYLCDVDYDGLKSVKNDLAEISSCKVHIEKVDLLNRSDVISYISKIDSVDILINNAGVRYEGNMFETPVETYRTNFAINFFAPLTIISEFINKAKQPKKIINILSTTVITGRRKMGLYSASKAAYWNFTRSLRRVFGDKIQIVEVIPSTMSQTRLIENSVVLNKHVQQDQNGRLKQPVPQKNKKMLKVDNWSAETAAKRIKKFEENGKEIIMIPPKKVFLYLVLDLVFPFLFNKLFRR